MGPLRRPTRFSTERRTGDVPGPGCFTPYDWSRSYLLRPEVRSNIPLRGSVGMLGAHNVARGLLVETCRHTGAHPTCLHYAETVLGDGAIIVVDVTATAHLPTNEPLTVHTRAQHRRHDDARDGDWSISIDGVVYTGEDRRRPPSPPVQGWIVHRLVRRATSG
ncbi:hypothetical protein [Pseudonocardia abyssalis]|uniref:Uncharacterized protein n=1 Tax=Pseudonocardia abyssalis TaxID=2792008 RepID=A0ABS6UN94_9PSEU|nr:hypothetical protein [Pseudonocardia abyssalis]MBW0115708.1 hypothetical protein [Pseudonocardia abyssalis]MBW0133274.1 hypothetical protein [Pseudonocardia abyssalis]